MAQRTQLTIVTWNCAGALRRKWRTLDALRANVIAVQECEDPARSDDAAYRAWAGESYRWTGGNPHKGLGLFWRHGHTARPLEWPTQAQHVLPALLGRIPLCAVWAHRGALGRPYVGQLHLALQSAPPWLDDPLCLLLGDFNSSAIWDRPRAISHSPTMAHLHQRGLRSAYHSHFGADQGVEMHPSFYLQRNLQKPYHIDYIYAARGWQIMDCTIGAPSDWLAHSDHMPLTARLRAL